MLFRSHGFYLFPVLARILPFFGTHTDSTLFGYSPGQFFDTRTDSIFSRYSPGFYHFSVHTQIRHFSVNRGDSFSILVPILAFPDTRPDCTIFRYSHRFDLFRYSWGQLLVTRTDSTFSRYSPGFNHFPVLTLILPFFETLPDSFLVLALILPFPGTRPDSTIFRYSH